jgi:hypothetical protein
MGYILSVSHCIHGNKSQPSWNLGFVQIRSVPQSEFPLEMGVRVVHPVPADQLWGEFYQSPIVESGVEYFGLGLVKDQ